MAQAQAAPRQKGIRRYQECAEEDNNEENVKEGNVH